MLNTELKKRAVNFVFWVYFNRFKTDFEENKFEYRSSIKKQSSCFKIAILLKLSFNNFPVKIFEQGFNCRFSAKFYTFFKKKAVYTELEQNTPFSLYFCH